MGIERAAAIRFMAAAFAKGQSATSFIAEMRTAGLSYRRTDMLADWRSEAGLKEKEGRMRYVRKDRYPTGIQEAKSWYAMSREYMYKVKVESRIRPGEPLTERFVNIMSDKALTPGQVESEVFRAWGEWEKYGAEQITQIQPWTAIHKVME